MSMYFNRLQPALQKPITMCCSVLSPEIVMHDDAYIGGRSENNIKCIVHNDLGWKNRTTLYILSHHWLYGWFSHFHRCGTYSVLSRSHSIVNDVIIISSLLLYSRFLTSFLCVSIPLCPQLPVWVQHCQHHLPNHAAFEFFSSLVCIVEHLLFTR